MSVSIEKRPATEIRPVRTAVLRPHFAPGELLIMPEDDLPDTHHLAALDPAGAVIGCVTYMRKPCPVDETPRAVQLRGMAVVEAWQGRGVGRALLVGADRLLFDPADEEGYGPLVAQGDAVVWCNARQHAEPFYEKLGFTGVGARFDIPGVGPHRVMVRPLGWAVEVGRAPAI